MIIIITIDRVRVGETQEEEEEEEEEYFEYGCWERNLGRLAAKTFVPPLASVRDFLFRFLFKPPPK
jgi:hypothetical protein